MMPAVILSLRYLLVYLKGLDRRRGSNGIAVPAIICEVGSPSFVNVKFQGRLLLGPGRLVCNHVRGTLDDTLGVESHGSRSIGYHLKPTCHIQGLRIFQPFQKENGDCKLIDK